MHDNSLTLMGQFFERYWAPLSPGKMLDVGAMNVNGAYRDYVPAGWHYVGLDQEPGPNVDVVAGVLPWPFPAASFGVVISGQCLEHTRNPFEVCREIGRVAKPGALVCLIAPWMWEIHRYPVDCWRILPDGMEILLGEAECEVIEARVDDRDCIGIGRRSSVEAELEEMKRRGLIGHVL